MRPVTLLLAATLAAAGCSDHEFHPPAEEDREAQAGAAYSIEAFDSISWATDAARIAAGNLVFADECRRCHGPLGRGDTEYARQNDLTVPSLVAEDWPYAASIDSVRRQIFIGHGEAMPSWGVGQLSSRQIDAAAAYILLQLRPEVLATDPQLPGN